MGVQLLNSDFAFSSGEFPKERDSLMPFFFGVLLPGCCCCSVATAAALSPVALPKPPMTLPSTSCFVVLKLNLLLCSAFLLVIFGEEGLFCITGLSPEGEVARFVLVDDEGDVVIDGVEDTDFGPRIVL